MPALRPRRHRPLVGLEIGSHLVRAAEVEVSGRLPLLRHYAQVDLPAGAVTDGEVTDPDAVGRAIKELWALGRFSGHRAVVGLSSQRVVVREAELPAMTDAEIKSALRFEAENLIPIPIDDAVLDFSIIDRPADRADPTNPGQTTILLAAAQRDMVNGHLAALAAAGVRPMAVDPGALALLRGVPSRHPPVDQPEESPTATLEAVISVAETMTTMAIREGDVPRFVRVLNVGSDTMRTASMTAANSLNPPAAGTASGDTRTQLASLLAATMTSGRPTLDGPTRTLVDDICGSLEFYLGKADIDRVDRIVVTGGDPGIDDFVTGLEARLRQAVDRADPLATITLGQTGLTPDQLDAAAPYMVIPIGLALWGSTSGRPITLLPQEVLRARRERHQAVAAAGVVLVIGALLMLAWSGRTARLASARQQTVTALARVDTLRGRISVLSKGTQVQGQVDASQSLYASALSGEVDWTRLMAQLSAVLPADVKLSTVSLEEPVTAAAAAGSVTQKLGSVTLVGLATGGATSVAAFLRALQTLPSLSSAWVQSIVQAPGPATGPPTKAVTFSASASVTKAAYSARSVQAATS